MAKRILTRHHLIPKERVKKKTHTTNQTHLNIDRVLYLWNDKHAAWHFLFRQMSLDEIIECLKRIKKIKSRD